MGSSYDPYDTPTRDRGSRRYYRDDRDPQDNYLRVHPSRDLVPRPREDSDLSVEEVRRDFPPLGYGGDIRRARSAEPGYYDDYDDRRSYNSRDYDRDRDRLYDRRHDKKAGSVYYEEEEKKRARMLSKQEKIIAAVAGAALAVGGKEIYDRREAHQDGTDVHRNALTSAALGAAGAFAGYQGAEFYNKRASKEDKKSTYIVHKGRDGRLSEYYSDDEEDADGREKKGHKNFLESALAAAGLGGAVKALTGGHHDDKRSDTRSRRGSDSSKSGAKGEGANKIQQAAMASLIAGATEAFRVSKEPGGWRGEKAKRILTAAAGAATIDAAHSDKHSKLALAESVIGGLVGNRVLNGSKKNIEEDKRTGRSRSRSRAASQGGGGGGGGGGGMGLAALATAGLGALGAKKIMDNRERSRSRQRSADSYDSRDGSPDKRRRSRSRSIVDTARRGLAKIGFGNDPESSRDRRRDVDDYDSPRGSGHGQRRHGSDDGYGDERGYGRGGRDDYDDDRSHNGRNRSRSRSRQGGARSGSESDLGDSSEDEKRAKKMRAPPRADRYDDGPRYVDGNPYSAALPAPPVGYSDGRR